MHSQQIIQAYQYVVSTLNSLCLHILDEVNYPLWIDNGAGALVADKDKLIYALKHFKLSPGLAPQETFACPGAVGANLITFEQIDRVNNAKTAFSQTIQDYLAPYKTQDTGLIRRILSDAGYPAIKLKQVTRHIVMIDFHPRRIAFTKARNSSNRVISRQEAEKRLLEAGQGLAIEIQLAKLALLGAQDKLVIHRDIKPYWAANISTFKNEVGHSQTIKKHTSLPLFYLHNIALTTPQVVYSKPISRSQACPRADKRIEEHPFLPSISAYRYKNKV